MSEHEHDEAVPANAGEFFSWLKRHNEREAANPSEEGGYLVPRVWEFGRYRWWERVWNWIMHPWVTCEFCGRRTRDSHRWDSVLVGIDEDPAAPVPFKFKNRCRVCSSRGAA